MVITGGTSGLGKCLAEMFAMKGVGVAVLDVRVPGDGLEEGWGRDNEALARVKFYRCDVGRLEEVQRAKERIEKDVCRPHLPHICFSGTSILFHSLCLDCKSTWLR